jgi:hypothetical protein
MQSKKALSIFFGLVVLACLAALVYARFYCDAEWCGVKTAEVTVSSYSECIKAGYLVMQAEDGTGRCRTPDGRVFLEKGGMTASSVASSQKAVEKNITVTSPKSGETVAKKFVVQGQARVFENVLNYRLKDEDGKVLTEGNMIANAEDVGLFGPFSVEIDTSTAKGKKGTLEVFSESAADGSDINMVKIPVTFTK